MDFSKFPLDKLMFVVAGVIPGFVALLIFDIAVPGSFAWFFALGFLGYRAKLSLIVLAALVIGYSPFSDFALHHMGSGLADGINQGTAGPDQFRTAPLWGIGQRLFFLHDGRTSDLLQAIEAHAGCTGARGHDQDRDHHRFNNCNSEAYRVIHNFSALSPSQQQDILNFLRSL